MKMLSEVGCPRVGKWIKGCLFEARYDLGPVEGLASIAKLKGTGAGAILEKFRRKTYVHDICIRCGTIIKRNAQ